MSLLAADRRHIAELDAQISELEAAISALRGRKAIAQERIDRYKYPVLTLPPEVMSEIFTHFLPTYPDRPPRTGALSPTRLTQICRTWREISLRTPSLWRAIDLSPKVDLSPPRLVQEALDTWVRRSGRCPMAVAFDFEPDPKLSSKGLLTSIASQRTRLEHLVLHLDHADRLRPFSGPMPRLRHLDLNFDDYNELESEAVLVFSASEAPLLRTVLLTYNPVTVALPWAQLTSLALHYVYPGECSPVLEQTTNLLFCHLNLVSDGDDLAPNPVTLRHLKLEPASELIPEYLHTFIVPSLRSLEINEGFLGNDPVQSLTAFMSKSGCNLQEIIIPEKHNISRSAYREAFPLISFSFIANWGDTDGSEATEGTESLDESGSESE